MKRPIIIKGQLIGLKNLKAVGGWRLEIDLFESELKDILSTTALVNEKKVVNISLEVLDEDKKPRRKTSDNQRKSFPI